MKLPLLLFSLLLFTFSLFAQTAERIESLLEQNRVGYAQAALFVLEAAELIEPDRMGEEEAFSYAQENNLLPKDVQGNYAVTLKGLSYMVMQAFGIKGGLFYTVTKSQHHAYRELVQRKIIQGRSADVHRRGFAAFHDKSDIATNGGGQTMNSPKSLSRRHGENGAHGEKKKKEQRNWE